MRRRDLLPLLTAPLLPGQGAPTLAMINARVWTGNPRQPWAEALAVAGGRIVAVGGSADIRRLTPARAEVIDAKGMMAVPGLHDCHIHFVTGGFRLSSVQLRDARTPQEFTRRVAEFAKTVPAGTWITGGDWDHTNWGSDLPTRKWLDAVTPNHPVWINRLDGHMALANSAALRAAGIGKSTRDVDGGTIVRDDDGHPTGVLKDNAMGLMGRAVPDQPAVLKDRALAAAMHYVAARGITSVHNMGSWDDLAVFERAHQAGKLNTRIYAAVPLATWERLAERVRSRGRGDSLLRIGGLKGYADGSLGSHTAAFVDPYSDLPSDTGLLVTTPRQLGEMTLGAARAGLQVMVHAIGDRAIRIQLNNIERTVQQLGPGDYRFRIEHAQHIHADDVPRFAQWNVIASMQPYHCIDDGRWAGRLIGDKRADTTYAFRDLLDRQVRLAFGSDWFVAPPTPLEGIYAAVTRRTLDGKNPGGWIPRQKISVTEALRAYTSDAAYASFEEREKGALMPGLLADFVLLSEDITRTAPERIQDTAVVRTVVGGKTVFAA